MTAALRGSRVWGTVAWVLLMAAAAGYVELSARNPSGLLRAALASIVLGGVIAAVLFFLRSRRLLETVSAASPREVPRPTGRVKRPSQRTTPPRIDPPSSPSA